MQEEGKKKNKNKESPFKYVTLTINDSLNKLKEIIEISYKNKNISSNITKMNVKSITFLIDKEEEKQGSFLAQELITDLVKLGAKKEEEGDI